MISPHTMMPTAHAAIQEPCHRVSVTWPCLLAGGSMPMREKAVDLHPVVTASSTARGAHRRARRVPPGRGVTGSPAVVWPGERLGPLPASRRHLGVARCGWDSQIAFPADDSRLHWPVIARPTACRGKQYRAAFPRLGGTPGVSGGGQWARLLTATPGYRYRDTREREFPEIPRLSGRTVAADGALRAKPDASQRGFRRGGDRVTPPKPPADAPASAPALTIDALGRKCPIPIIMLAERIREVPIGQVVAVLADDPAARTDVPAWCMIKSQEFVTAIDLPSGWAFLVRRSY